MLNMDIDNNIRKKNILHNLCLKFPKKYTYHFWKVGYFLTRGIFTVMNFIFYMLIKITRCIFFASSSEEFSSQFVALLRIKAMLVS